MAYTTVEAREEMLETIGEAADRLGTALACFGEAYEQLDDDTADRLEAELFGPAQSAYGRARKTHDGFAARAGLLPRAFEPQSPGPHSADSRAYIERGVEAARAADQLLADLQDSMRPVEVGDLELRNGLTGVRELASVLPDRARELTRTLGR
jgi:hypothetical protein